MPPQPTPPPVYPPPPPPQLQVPPQPTPTSFFARYRAVILLLVLILGTLGGGTLAYFLSKPATEEVAIRPSPSPGQPQPVLVQPKEPRLPPQTADFRVASVVPAVVQLQCFINANDPEPATLGSGFSFYDQDGHGISTNAHVVRVNKNKLVDGCYVYFPNPDGTFYESAYWAGEVYPVDDKKVVINGVEVGGTTFEDGGLDYATVKLTEAAITEDNKTFPPPSSREFPDINKIREQTCRAEEGDELEIGEKLFVLGYPAVGGQDMTITEGIISGFESVGGTEWIKTSAKVEQGHSGGIVVRAKDGCLIGIPTIVGYGKLESIARILPFYFINLFLEALPKE